VLAWQGPSWGAAIAVAGRRRFGCGATRRAAGACGAAQLGRAAAAVQVAGGDCRARSPAARAVLLADPRRWRVYA